MEAKGIESEEERMERKGRLMLCIRCFMGSPQLQLSRLLC